MPVQRTLSSWITHKFEFTKESDKEYCDLFCPGRETIEEK
jgi:hypothetical protein